MSPRMNVVWWIAIALGVTSLGLVKAAAHDGHVCVCPPPPECASIEAQEAAAEAKRLIEALAK